MQFQNKQTQQGNRTYLIVNGNERGYYRQKLLGGVRCVVHLPFYQEVDFDSVDGGKDWLIEQAMS